VNRIIYILL